MMMRPRYVLAAGTVALIVAGGLVLRAGSGYEVQMIMPSASHLSERTPVWINGQHAGQVEALRVRDGKAVVTISVDDDFGQLHAGTSSRVEWLSAIGERVLTVYPGPTKNAAVPSGSYLEGQSSQIEVDQVLAALDAPTRERVNSLVARLDTTLSGREADLQSAISSASGTVAALGEVLRGVGHDGPAVRALVAQLTQMTELAASRKSQIASTVSDLDTATGVLADNQAALSRSIKKLPGTLETARTTLGKVPTASDSTIDLLEDLRPATGKLPAISADLAPTLVDLRPTVTELTPLMRSADLLLDRTPGLLDASHQVLPTVDNLLGGLEPAISFLRPYTPEAVGGLYNWGQAFAPYDGAGHTWAGLLGPGTSLLDESLVPVPTARQNPAPPPGQPVDQPWTDATGSKLR